MAGWCDLDSYGSGQGAMVVSYEYGKKPLPSIKDRPFLD
jgi:hypothetical protein